VIASDCVVVSKHISVALSKLIALPTSVTNLLFDIIRKIEKRRVVENVSEKDQICLFHLSVLIFNSLRMSG
jgi:hypothetical protein